MTRREVAVRQVAMSVRAGSRSGAARPVAHAISVMVIQAGAGQRLAANNAELTRSTFEAIAGAAREHCYQKSSESPTFLPP